ncbi:MAG TPA: GNAT family N-acetyltransferase [Thermoleophilaceae bacterium]|nr:GNAT family N-acetyltransferase [Thermoleophilaceae bacterium]
MTVRPLAEPDRAGWVPLWEDYNSFYRHRAEPEVTELTFTRLCAGEEMFGLVAEHDGRVAGFAHCLLHPSTWTTASYCYLEDLFVDRGARGTDLGTALIEAVSTEANARGAVRVYWHTQEYNGAARSLYDQVARRTSFIKYER